MAQELISHNVLSLDFWQDTVTYAGSVMPTGTIGCAVLNIPGETIARLDAPCTILESTADRHWLKERGYAASSESAGGGTGYHSHAARCPTVLPLGQKAV